MFKQPNYHHARNQKAQARKARQQEKQARRTTRQVPAGEQSTEQVADTPTPPDVTLEDKK